jgi:hypothetical protein
METPTGILCFLAAGITALLAVALHAALWFAMKRGGGSGLARILWWGVIVASAATVAAGFAIRPWLAGTFEAAPWGYAFPVIALAGLMGVEICKAPDARMLAYLSSSAYIAGALSTIGFLTGVGPAGWASGAILVAGYMVWASWQFWRRADYEPVAAH